MLKTFVVHVENKPGVLTRVASLFRRRAFNIDSLTVGRTEKPEVSRMTITVEADHDQGRRIEASLYKLVNVLLVEDITDEPAITRDLAMIKVAAQHDQRSHVLQLVEVFRARVVDVSPESVTLKSPAAKRKSTACSKCYARSVWWRWCVLASWPCGEEANPLRSRPSRTNWTRSRPRPRTTKDNLCKLWGGPNPV